MISAAVALLLQHPPRHRPPPLLALDERVRPLFRPAPRLAAQRSFLFLHPRRPPRECALREFESWLGQSLGLDEDGLAMCLALFERALLRDPGCWRPCCARLVLLACAALAAMFTAGDRDDWSDSGTVYDALGGDLALGFDDFNDVLMTCFKTLEWRIPLEAHTYDMYKTALREHWAGSGDETDSTCTTLVLA